MPDVNSRAILPKGEANGLAAVAKALLDAPLQLHAALIVFDLKWGKTDFDVSDTMGTVRVRRVELLLPQDLDAAQQMIRRSLEHRSGLATLPLELEDELEATFREMDVDPDNPGADPDEPGEPGKEGTA